MLDGSGHQLKGWSRAGRKRSWLDVRLRDNREANDMVVDFSVGAIGVQSEIEGCRDWLEDVSDASKGFVDRREEVDAVVDGRARVLGKGVDLGVETDVR